MQNLLNSLKDEQLLVIACEDSKIRKYIHDYVTKNSSLGHVGLSTSCEKCVTQTFTFCCDKKLVLKYNRGIIENNIDEYYSGICPICFDIYIWECNFCDRYNIYRKEYNNCICIGKSIKISPPNQKHCQDIPEVDFLNFFETMKYNIITSIPNWELRGSQGKKGRKYLNKKKCILVDHIDKSLFDMRNSRMNLKSARKINV